MTGNDLPANPSVLNTTVLSNFAYIDQLWIGDPPNLRYQSRDDSNTALLSTDISNTERFDETVRRFRRRSQTEKPFVGETSRPGEAQAFALADAHDGRLLTDDGDARSFAKDQGVTVVGSVGVLLAAIDAGRIDEATADEWLSKWIDEIGYYVPYRTISEYRCGSSEDDNARKSSETSWTRQRPSFTSTIC